MIAPVVSLYASLLALMVIYLAVRVVRLRRSQKIGLGDGGDPKLEHAMRVMGNFIEYVPLALILIALLEINRTPGWMIHVYGSLLLLGRILHLVGFGGHTGVTPGRFIGTALTWLVIVLSALTNLVHYVIWLR
ncbi:MAG: MAPEG family protein [Pseudomonadota bacterium]